MQISACCFLVTAASQLLVHCVLYVDRKWLSSFTRHANQCALFLNNCCLTASCSLCFVCRQKWLSSFRRHAIQCAPLFFLLICLHTAMPCPLTIMLMCRRRPPPSGVMHLGRHPLSHTQNICIYNYFPSPLRWLMRRKQLLPLRPHALQQAPLISVLTPRVIAYINSPHPYAKYCAGSSCCHSGGMHLGRHSWSLTSHQSNCIHQFPLRLRWKMCRKQLLPFRHHAPQQALLISHPNYLHTSIPLTLTAPFWYAGNGRRHSGGMHFSRHSWSHTQNICTYI